MTRKLAFGLTQDAMGRWQRSRIALMVVIPVDRKRLGQGFDSPHLHLSACVVGVYLGGDVPVSTGRQRRAGNPKGDGRNPSKSLNANKLHFAFGQAANEGNFAVAA